MARKLKRFQTSLGFYDLAIAAPSMRRRWRLGARVAIFSIRASLRRRTFRRGCRPCRSLGWYSGVLRIDRSLCRVLGLAQGSGTASVRKRSRPAPKKHRAPKVSEESARKAADDSERVQSRREAERAKEMAALEKERARRDKLVAKAQAALDGGAAGAR